MFSNIVVPVDLAHLDALDKALSIAADLARHYQATVTMVSVTASAPSEIAHNPEEFGDKLRELAAARSDALDVHFDSRAITAADPAVDLEKILDKAIHELSADLVIMASHAPTFRDYFMRSHSGYLATHTDVSVFIVR